MIKAIKKLFGIKTTDYVQLMQDGAVILDVRTPGEFSTGHIQGSINISVEKLPHSLNKLKNKNKPIITCCASGMRSATARNILQSNGFTNVYNGGAWFNLNMKLSQ
jgi:rhodanese-related sulfurtransferase